MRPRADSLVLNKEDALSAGVGMLCGLLAFSRDLSEFAGGAIVLSLLLLALSEDKVDKMDKDKDPEAPVRTWVRLFVSWALLWTALASLEVTTTRWSTPLSLVYALYYVSRASGWGILGMLSIFGVVLCHLSARKFAVWRPNDGVLIALSLHACCWTANLRLRPKCLSLDPKAILLDAPLSTVREAILGRRASRVQ
jgi:hypothetical protein